MPQDERSGVVFEEMLHLIAIASGESEQTEQPSKESVGLTKSLTTKFSLFTQGVSA